MLGTTGCGYILHPERRGRTGGRIDATMLVFDLLWLLPGLVPGAICLIVDFTTGCIYEGGARASTAPPTRGSVPRVAAVEVELDGATVATGHVEPDRSARLRWTRAVDETALRVKGRVTVRARDGALAQAHVRDLF